MNIQKVVKELRRKYPGKKIVMNDPDDPSEIICEVEPSSVSSDKSLAIAVIDNVIHHYHKNSEEVYEVVRGTLVVTINGKQSTLIPGQSIRIRPDQVHSAEGHGTWVKVTSRPAWTPDDHYVVADSVDEK
ncbi:cupin domain-containing protein [Patescibacteria group bacterium]